ncbi:MAG: glycosyltransferase family 2 protein [Nostocales cyanobacterium 94392]|nr:glycosyltransferase family 2 protein [Nostocales cyanobacterium 94392]
MISIITPVYNGEKFIELCLKNVIDQDCQELEHIIVDGGSTDRTVEIIEQYAHKYPHIRWISEKDKGQSDAMNKGINMAKGEILSFLNVDDFYQPNALHSVCKFFQELPEPSLLVGNCNLLNNHDEIKSINKPKRLNIVQLLTKTNFCIFPLNPSAYFYHKSLHQKIGLYKVDEHYMMDLDFIFKAVQNANVKYVDEIWGNHRQIEGTKTINLVSSGKHYLHLSSLIEEHRKQLTKFQQFKVFYLRFFYSKLDRLIFLYKQPEELRPYLKNKFMKNKS